MIESVRFHKNSEILFTAGPDKKLRLFSISESPKKIQTVYYADMPIFTAEYFNGWTEVICTGNRKHFYTYSLEKQIPEKIIPTYADNVKHLKSCSVSHDKSMFSICQDNGVIHLHDSKNKMLLYDIKVSGEPAAVEFTSDENLMLVESKDGTIWHFDRRTKKCIESIRDDGVINCTAAGCSSQYYASGCSSGAVNIYGLANGRVSGKPLKQILNMTTKVTGILFNHNNELCAMYSKWKKNSLKLLHLNSMSVFSNFPDLKYNLKYVTSVDISPRSGMMCVGNDTGRALLFKLNHYISI